MFASIDKPVVHQVIEVTMSILLLHVEIQQVTFSTQYYESCVSICGIFRESKSSVYRKC